MNNQKYRIKIVKGLYNTLYYPQYYQEPLVVFGITLFKGRWEYFLNDRVPVFTEYYSSKEVFKTLDDAKMFLKRENYEDKISYVDYP